MAGIETRVLVWQLDTWQMGVWQNYSLSTGNPPTLQCDLTLEEEIRKAKRRAHMK